MNAGTSPAMTPVTGNNAYEIAWQGSDGNLWVKGTDATGAIGLPIMAGTSPAITGLVNGGFETAYQGRNAHLFFWGDVGDGDEGYGMMPGTNPALIPNPNG
jgi:hypothetical protein